MDNTKIEQAASKAKINAIADAAIEVQALLQACGIQEFEYRLVFSLAERTAYLFHSSEYQQSDQ